MIFDYILNAFLDRFQAIVDALPTASFPSGWLDTFTTIQNTIDRIQTIFPVDVALAVVAFVLFVEGVVLTLKISNSLFTKVRGSG